MAFLRDEDILVEQAEEALQALGYQLVQFIVVPQKKGPRIRVFIFHEHGISHRDCEMVSLSLQPILTKQFGDNFSLEVSSPGINRVLKSDKEYQLFKGKRIKAIISPESNNQSPKILTGILIGKDKDTIQIQVEEQIVNISSFKTKRVELTD